MTAPTRKIRHGLAALAALLALPAVLPAAAFADRTAEVSMMDDQALLGATREKIDHEMEIYRELGVDRVRVSAFWSQIVPFSANNLTKPAGFVAENPGSPGYHWGDLDRVVQSAREHGMKVMVSITTPAPLWATAQPSRRDPVWKPRASEFGLFAQAVATRYRGAVDHYGISNEPNQPQWLLPQYEGGKFVAPHTYRAMVQAAYPRIKAVDPSALALVGELAAAGSRVKGVRRPSRPLAFLRTMACRNSRYRPMRSGRCRGFSPVIADAIGHHPYQFFLAPTTPSPEQGRRRHRRRPAALADHRSPVAHARAAPPVGPQVQRCTTRSSATRRTRPIRPASRCASTPRSWPRPPTSPTGPRASRS